MNSGDKKLCIKCKQILPLEKFDNGRNMCREDRNAASRERIKNSTDMKTCILCGKNKLRKFFHGKICYVCRDKTPEHKISEIKSRALKDNIPFNDNDRIIMSQKLCHPCFYCNYKPVNVNESIGLDRVNNDYGYCNNNVVSCCITCNYMKNKLTGSEFIDHIKQILHYNNYDIPMEYTLNQMLLSRTKNNDKHMDTELYLLTTSELNLLKLKPCYLCGVIKSGSISRINYGSVHSIVNSRPCCRKCINLKHYYEDVDCLHHISNIVFIMKKYPERINELLLKSTFNHPSNMKRN